MSQKWPNNLVREFSDTVCAIVNDFLGVEVWHTFATYGTSHDVLVCVNYRINASLAKFVYKLINFFKVSVIVNTGFPLDRFPHDAEPD